MSRESHLRLKYGLTPQEYEDILQAQNDSCWICGRHRSIFKKNLCVDHNHKTGEVRGILCDYCNRRLVGRHTDPVLLRKIADYLEQGTGRFVPEKKKSNTKRRSLPRSGSIRRSKR